VARKQLHFSLTPTQLAYVESDAVVNAIIGPMGDGHPATRLQYNHPGIFRNFIPIQWTTIYRLLFTGVSSLGKIKRNIQKPPPLG
jgi:hypothetical protein